jgi:hypothetical protein
MGRAAGDGAAGGQGHGLPGAGEEARARVAPPYCWVVAEAAGTGRRAVLR